MVSRIFLTEIYVKAKLLKRPNPVVSSSQSKEKKGEGGRTLYVKAEGSYGA